MQVRGGEERRGSSAQHAGLAVLHINPHPTEQVWLRGGGPDLQDTLQGVLLRTSKQRCKRQTEDMSSFDNVQKSSTLETNTTNPIVIMCI